MTKRKTLLAWLATLFVSVSPATLPAQTAPDAANRPSDTAANAEDWGARSVPTKNGSDQIVQMSAFEVRTTQGQGYSEGNSASALKSAQSLMGLPQQIIVVSSDMINDIGAVLSSNVLAYAGVAPFARGATVESRGSRVGNPYLDDVPQAAPQADVEDNANIDAYEVIKGPVQIFYPLASLGGTVLKTTKKPLPGVTQQTVSFSISQWGGERATFDFNGPAGTLGDGRLTYRVIGAQQGGNQPFTDVRDDHYCIYPDLEYDWHRTSLILSYDVQLLYYLPGATSVLTPSGNLYTGDGRRIEGAPHNDTDKNEQHDLRGVWIQHLSDNWEIKSQAVFWNMQRYGSVGFPSTVNWNTDQVTYTIRLDHAYVSVATVQSDVSGKYSLGSLPNQSLFGFNNQDSVSYSEYWVAPTATIPLGSPAAIQSIVLPPTTAFVSPADPGSRTEQYVSNAYYMHTIDVVPNWLTLVGGFTFSKIETVTDTNIAVASPYNATDLNGHDLLHRIAAIVHLGKDLMLYACESTTFSPSAGVNYFNTPLPPVLGKSDEVGLKTDFLNNRVSLSVAAYKMVLTNQAIAVAFPALNIAGFNYSTPIGSTTSKGFDGSLALQVAPGWQIIAAGYSGTVEDQNGNPVASTYDNQWSFFNRYDFDRSSALRGLAFGGGLYRIGSRYFNMSGLVLPGAAPLKPNSSGVALFKLHEGTMMNLFVSYQMNKHWVFRANCENALDEAFPLGAQGVGLVDPSDPRTITLQASYSF